MAEQTILEGTITRAGAPVEQAYVRILDPSGNFTGERRTAGDGQFRFYLEAGRWSVVVLAAGAKRSVTDVELAQGEHRTLSVGLG